MTLKIEDPILKKVIEKVLESYTSEDPSRDWRITQITQRISQLMEEEKEKSAIL